MHRAITTASTILAFSFLLMGGCGQTGPLYLPNEDIEPSNEEPLVSEVSEIATEEP